MRRETHTGLGYGVSGWKARQNAAEKRAEMNKGELLKNNNIRRAIREWEEAVTAHVSEAKARGEDKDKAYAEFVAQNPHPTSSQPENDGSADVNEEAGSDVWTDDDSSDDVDSMDRDALVAALVDAGEKKPHPNTKLETLRKKVRELS